MPAQSASSNAGELLGSLGFLDEDHSDLVTCAWRFNGSLESEGFAIFGELPNLPHGDFNIPFQRVHDANSCKLYLIAALVEFRSDPGHSANLVAFFNVNSYLLAAEFITGVVWSKKQCHGSTIVGRLRVGRPETSADDTTSGCRGGRSTAWVGNYVRIACGAIP